MISAASSAGEGRRQSFRAAPCGQDSRRGKRMARHRRVRRLKDRTGRARRERTDPPRQSKAENKVLGAKKSWLSSYLAADCAGVERSRNCWVKTLLMASDPLLDRGQPRGGSVGAFLPTPAPGSCPIL